MASDDGQDVSDPALDKTVSAEAAGVTQGTAVADGGRLAAGMRLGRYEIVEFIGGGGMGWVYRANDTELEREVAIKVVQPTVAGPKGRERLLAEARAMAKLRHRAVVPVFDVGEHAGGVYVAMALVTGGTLHDWMHAEARPWRQVVARFLEAGRGLVAAHAAGIVHRDFKPRNVLVGPGGEVAVADFGIASASADGGDGEGGPGGAREATSIVGTPAYMAPEQAAGQAVDARADQYSFCVSLWEGLHGQRPQEAETRTQGALLERSSAAPKSRRRVPGWLTDAVARGFAPAPEKRWPSMAALLDRLERGLAWRRRAAVVATATTTVVAIALSASLLTRRAAPTLCPVPSGLTWDANVRAKIVRAFRETRVAYGADAAERVVADLDLYVSGWRERMVASCRATNIEHAQSTSLFDRRLACLETRRAYANGLIETLAQADRIIVANAADAVARLPALEACDQSEALLSRPQPPPDKADQVAAVYAKIVSARSARDRGRWQPALELAESAVADARVIGWSPLTTEALSEVAALRGQMLRPSATELAELALEAGRAKDDVGVLTAQLELYAMETQRGNLDRAVALEPVLLGTLARVDGARWLQVRARVVMAARRGQPRAKELLDEAEHLATTPAQRAAALGARGMGELSAKRAIELYRQAVAEAAKGFGDHHPALGKAYLDLAVARYRAGDLEGAVGEWQAAGRLYDEAYGDVDNPMVADYLQLGGMLAEMRGDDDDGIAKVRRASEIYGAAGMVKAQAQAERNLANIVAYKAGGAAEGERYYRHALALLEAEYGRDSVEYADVEASLGIYLASESCPRGVALLEHAQQVLGPLRHPLLPGTLGQLADCVAAENPERAMQYYEAVLAMCNERGCMAGLKEQISFSRGRLLMAAPSTRASGRTLLQTALDGFLRLNLQEDAEEVRRELKKWPR